jgi:hypothetical protein
MATNRNDIIRDIITALGGTPQGKSRNELLAEWLEAAGVWTPANITTEAWYDANDSSTITMLGNNVSEWADKSGNNHHLQQASASNQPSYVLSSQNGKNIIRFSGTDYLDIQSVNINDSGFAIFMVFKYSSDRGAVINFHNSDFHSILPDHGFRYGTLLGHGSNWAGVNDNLRPFGTSGQSNSFCISSLIVNSSNSASLKVNDSEIYNVNSSYSSNTNQLRLGSRYSLAQYCNGDYCEFVIIKGGVTTSNIEKIEGYLAHKWGISSQLSSSHTYKNSPPED